MKKFSLIVMLVVCLTVGGVFAGWVYMEKDDVADTQENISMNLTAPSFAGTYGSFDVDISNIALKVDPKTGTTHTTDLVVEGQIVIKFTPNTHAPAEIKAGGLDNCSWSLALTNSDWRYDSTLIVSNIDTSAQDITWTPNGAGAFTCTVSAETIKSMITLSEIVLDTKAEYDQYNTQLGNGQIAFAVTDGKTTPVTP